MRWHWALLGAGLVWGACAPAVAPAPPLVPDLAGPSSPAPAQPPTRVLTQPPIRGNPPAAVAPSPTPASTRCAEAASQVRAYRPTPRSGTVQENVARTFASQSRAAAIQVEGWGAAENGLACTVALTYTENGQPRTLGWLYTPRSGRVEPIDDWTRQSSGFP